MDVKYVIKRGDSLWDLAVRHLGDSAQWPLIYEHNNLPQVTALTRSRISDPDLIFVGQVIYIPKLVGILNRSLLPSQVGLKPQVLSVATGLGSRDPGSKGNAPYVSHMGWGRTVACPKVRSVPFKYQLSDVPTISVASANHVATVTLKGVLSLQAIDTVDFPTVAQKGFELRVKQRTDQVFGTLVGGTKVGYNAGTNEISFENRFTRRSTARLTPGPGVAVTRSSRTVIPPYKGAVIAVPREGGEGRGHTADPSVPGIRVGGAPSEPGLHGKKGAVKGDSSFREHDWIIPVEPRTEVSVSVSPQPDLSLLKGTIKAPPVRGKINGHVYVVQDLTIEFELSPKGPSAIPQPLGGAGHERAPTGSSFTWEYLVATGSGGGKGVLIKSSIVEDIVTLAEGVGDDVPSFAVAAALLVDGKSKMQPVGGVDPIPIEGHGVPTGQRLA